jgi:hypothetical protein
MFCKYDTAPDSIRAKESQECHNDIALPTSQQPFTPIELPSVDHLILHRNLAPPKVVSSAIEYVHSKRESAAKNHPITTATTLEANHARLPANHHYHPPLSVVDKSSKTSSDSTAFNPSSAKAAVSYNNSLVSPQQGIMSQLTQKLPPKGGAVRPSWGDSHPAATPTLPIDVPELQKRSLTSSTTFITSSGVNNPEVSLPTTNMRPFPPSIGSKRYNHQFLATSPSKQPPRSITVSPYPSEMPIASNHPFPRAQKAIHALSQTTVEPHLPPSDQPMILKRARINETSSDMAAKYSAVDMGPTSQLSQVQQAYRLPHGRPIFSSTTASHQGLSSQHTVPSKIPSSLPTRFQPSYEKPSSVSNNIPSVYVRNSETIHRSPLKQQPPS